MLYVHKVPNIYVLQCIEKVLAGTILFHCCNCNNCVTWFSHIARG